MDHVRGVGGGGGGSSIIRILRVWEALEALNNCVLRLWEALGAPVTNDAKGLGGSAKERTSRAWGGSGWGSGVGAAGRPLGV